MTRLPALQRALHDAAARRQQPAIRRRRGRTVLLATAATVAVSGGALAATGVLETGEPVPTEADPPIVSQPGTARVLPLRVPDPDGGPAWGLLTYRAAGSGTCLVAGRVQGDRLGVVGRDGVFADDGRFHPVDADAALSKVCGGAPLGGSAPPIPASGYSGAPGTAIGGCREDVDLDGPTVSPQTARRLRDVPICPPSSRRVVKYGLAGPAARTVTYGNAASSQTVTVAPGTDGAYLFVFDTTPTGAGRRQLTATLDDGSTCGPGDRDDRDPGLVSCLMDHAHP